MAAFFNVIFVFVPALLLLPSLSQERCNAKVKKLSDEMKPLHFKILYLALLIVGTFIVGSSLLKLFYNDAGNQNNNRSNYENANDSSRRPLQPLWDLARMFLYGEHQRQSRNYSEAAFLLISWLAPIFSLLFIIPWRRPDQNGCNGNHMSSLSLKERIEPNSSPTEMKSKIVDNFNHCSYGSLSSIVGGM